MYKLDCKDCITYPICRNVLVDAIKSRAERSVFPYKEIIYLAVTVLEHRCEIYNSHLESMSVEDYVKFTIDSFSLIESEILNGQT